MNLDIEVIFQLLIHCLFITHFFQILVYCTKRTIQYICQNIVGSK